MNRDLRAWILSAIQEHAGRWYWLQMDRALSIEGKTDWLPLLMPTLHRLEQEKLIEYTAAPTCPSIRYYKLTAVGHDALRAQPSGPGDGQ